MAVVSSEDVNCPNHVIISLRRLLIQPTETFSLNWVSRKKIKYYPILILHLFIFVGVSFSCHWKNIRPSNEKIRPSLFLFLPPLLLIDWRSLILGHFKICWHGWGHETDTHVVLTAWCGIILNSRCHQTLKEITQRYWSRNLAVYLSYFSCLTPCGCVWVSLWV